MEGREEDADGVSDLNDERLASMTWLRAAGQLTLLNVWLGVYYSLHTVTFDFLLASNFLAFPQTQLKF